MNRQVGRIALHPLRQPGCPDMLGNMLRILGFASPDFSGFALSETFVSFTLTDGEVTPEGTKSQAAK